MDYCSLRCSHTLLERRALDYLKGLYTKKLSLWHCQICKCKFQITNNDNPPPTPHKRISKIQLCWNIRELLKRFDTQTLLFMVSSKSQRTPPKDRELFDNVYNRHPKAAEVHQMLRQDGARRSPPGRMRSGTRSGFWKLKAPKGQQRFWYTCWVLRNWTPAGAVGREALIADCQRDEKV